jgi:hypothetical protein
MHDAIAETLPGWATYFAVVFTVVLGFLVGDFFGLGILSRVVVTLVIYVIFSKTFGLILN